MMCRYARCGRDVPAGAQFCPWCGRKQVRDTKKKHRRANGTGSVYKMGGKRRKPWIALKNGKSIGQCFSTEKEALDALTAFEEVRDVELFNLTVKGVYDRWSKSVFASAKKSFVNDYSNAWKHVPDQMRNKLFREIKAADMQDVIDSVFQKGRSESAQQKVKALFSFLCSFASANDIISKDYSDYLTVTKTERRKSCSVFTAEELRKIADLADGDPESAQVQTARIIMIYLFTGMRISELLPLRRDAVHMDEAFPYLIGGEKTEAGIDRVIPIIKEIQPFVRWFLYHGDGDMLFSAYAGNRNPNNWRTRDYYPLLDSLEIQRHAPHDTRRTTATMAVEERVAPDALQKIGGWREFQTVQKFYNRPSVEYLSSEFEKLGNAAAKRRKASGEKNS